MAAERGVGKGKNLPITIRLPDEDFFYYRSKAHEEGIGFNKYLTKYLIEGHLVAKVAEFETRMAAVIGKIPQEIKVGESNTLDAILVSVLTSEAILSQIAKSQDETILMRAQKAAADHFDNMKSARDGN